ncbi:MAG: hypothetical protein ACYDAO_09105 [Thermoplasmataceae archaeon]
MKAKKLLAVVISLLIILSSILTVYPLIVENNYRASLNQNPMEPGSYLIYQFGSLTNQTKGNNTVLYPQCGIIELNVISESKILARTKICVPGVGDYYWNNTYNINNGFISYFVNNASLSQLLVNIGGVISKVSGASSSFPSSFFNANTVSGYTKPTKLIPINVNETLASKNNNYLYYSNASPNKFEYDQSGGSNVLILSQINGNISLISELFDRSMPYAIDFTINLQKTNLELNPIDLKMYLLPNIGYVLTMWIVSIPLLYLTIRRAKKRALKKMD